jgi:hypothetical protein
VKTGERRGNAGLWKTKENQNQVSLRFPPPFGNRCRDSHIPTAPATPLSFESEQEKTTERSPALLPPDYIPSGSFMD